MLDLIQLVIALLFLAAGLYLYSPLFAAYYLMGVGVIFSADALISIYGESE